MFGTSSRDAAPSLHHNSSTYSRGSGRPVINTITNKPTFSSKMKMEPSRPVPTAQLANQEYMNRAIQRPVTATAQQDTSIH